MSEGSPSKSGGDDSGIPTDSCVVSGFSHLYLNLKRFGLFYGIDGISLELKGEFWSNKEEMVMFGVPSGIICDNNSQFISKKTRKFCDERGIKLITSTPRYPQSNGLTESSNKVVINSIHAPEELRHDAFQKVESQKAMIERYFNKKVKAKVFQVGDYVLRHVFQNTQELNAGKLSIKWEGPYRISKVIGNGAYKLTTLEGKEIPHSWKANHLKRYCF
ncbi:hypothetical protein OSB04_025959 [Centaurea solstitialis]|uniref:Integrase catalytic domain-containing protein n=1 Tax=Centaurea solstitialis TaxID=347529 RepID=A0AA38T7I1_9ASTR|nr:hypothetical protein OSB04_025959 [Centaurea solstitialis]